MEIEILVSSKVESLLYVMASFGTDLEVWQPCLLYFGSNSLRAYLPTIA